MLDASLPIGLGPNGYSSQVSSETVVTRPAASSSIEGQHCYYHSTSADTGSYHQLPNESGRTKSANIEAQLSLEETRRGALQTLMMCRHVIATLEITRLQKSRKGLYHWLGFWDHLYDRSFSRLLACRVSNALYKVDALFRNVSNDLHLLTRRMEQVVGMASSEKEILHVLERMEEEVGVRRRKRRRKAQHILGKMRRKIEAIPVKVNEELFDDMKRGVFALDIFCDYHPGDSTAEQIESMWPDHFFQQPTGMVAISPYLYRQWREESAVAGTYIPLTAYSSNINWPESLEQRVRDIDAHNDNQWAARESSQTLRW